MRGPLLAVFSAGDVTRGPALDAGSLAEPSPTSRHPPSSTTPPPALRCRQCKARFKRRWDGSSRATITATRWAQATGAPRAGRSRPSTPRRFYAPVWVERKRPDRARGGRRSTQLKRAPDDGLNLSAFALPRDLGSGLDPDAIAEAETTIASAVVAYAEQASGIARPTVACLAAHLRERRASSIPASLWPKRPRRRIQPGGSPTSTRRRGATARCATN